MITTETFWSVDGSPLQTFAFNIDTWGDGREGVPSFRGDDVTVPFSPGDVWFKKVPASRTINLSMWVIGAELDGTIPTDKTRRQAFEENWYKLKTLLWQPDRQINLTKRFYRDGELVEATAKAQFVSGLEPTMTGTQRAKFVVQLKLANPFFYGARETILLDPGTTDDIEVKGDYTTNKVEVKVNAGSNALNTPIISTTSSIGDVYMWLPDNTSERISNGKRTINYAKKIEGSGTLTTIAKNYAPRIEPSGTWAEVRRNFMRNPSFEDSLTTWSANANVSIERVPDGEGGWAIRVTRTGAGDPIGYAWTSAPLEPGTRSFQLEAKGDGVTALSQNVRLQENGAGYRTLSTGISVGTVIPAEWTAYEGAEITSVVEPTVVPRINLRPGTNIGEFIDYRMVYVGAPGPSFDGSTVGDQIQPEDFRTRWLGEPNASESVMEIETVAGYTALNCVAGLSTRDGEPAIRLIPISLVSTDSFANFTIPVAPRSGGVFVGTRHLNAPITGTTNSNARFLKPVVLAPEQSPGSIRDANLPGEIAYRTLFSALVAPNQARLYHGGLAGSGDVWWTDIQLYEGDYRLPWTGTEDISMLDQPEDFTVVQESDGLALKGESVRHWIGYNSAPVLSDSGNTIRIIPTNSATSSLAYFNILNKRTEIGTAVATFRLKNSLTGNLNTLSRRIRMNTPPTENGLSVSTPNEPGIYELRTGPFKLPGPIYQFQLYVGASAGNGEVWASKLGLFAGNYDGPWFDGDTPSNGRLIDRHLEIGTTIQPSQEAVIDVAQFQARLGNSNINGFIEASPGYWFDLTPGHHSISLSASSGSGFSATITYMPAYL